MENSVRQIGGKDRSQKDLSLLNLIKTFAAGTYEKGGSYIIETFTDDEILEEFETLAQAKRYCKMMKNREDDICNS
jgi:hypothetical protein